MFGNRYTLINTRAFMIGSPNIPQQMTIRDKGVATDKILVPCFSIGKMFVIEAEAVVID